jgi:sarcosine oxidase subunit beta
VAAAAYEPDAGFADPYLVATGFAREAERQGADIRPGERVTDIELENKTPVAIQTTENRVPVDFVINAAGPWGDKIGQMVGLELDLNWHESKVAVLSGSESYSADQPTLSDSPQRLYVKPEPGNTFIVGGINRPEVDRKNGTEGVTTEYLNKIQKALSHRLPRYKNADVVDTWSGIITATPDWYQIVGVPKDYSNFYNAIGGGGHGFKEAPGFAESIAQDILGKTPSHNLAPYRLERFKEGDLLADHEKEHREEN